MRAVGQADRGRGAGDFLDRDGMGEVAHARPAVFLLDRDAEQAELAHLAPELVGEGVRPVGVGRDRLHALLRPAMDHVAQGGDLVAEVEGHRGSEHAASPAFIERLFK